MRDPRTQNAEGQRAIADVVRNLNAADPEWMRRFDEATQSLSPLSLAWDEARRKLKNVALDEPVVASQILRVDNAIELDQARRTELATRAWNAVYRAYRSGGDAGPALALPVAALRWLHTSDLAERQLLQTRPSLEVALSATPVIGLNKVAGIDQPPPPRPQPDRPPASSQQRFENLANDIVTAEQLVATARAAARQRMQPTVKKQEGFQSTNFVVGNVPQLRMAVGRQPTQAQMQLMRAIDVNDDTSVPVAITRLEGHLSQLNREAYSLRHDTQFLHFVSTSNNPSLIKLIPPNPDLIHNPITEHVAIADPTADVDVKGRIRPLGIGDLKVVKQTLLAYEAGEVAHIENVLKGEVKERKHRAFDRTETILVVSEEETKESERDTQTTDRFELKREAERTIKEEMKVEAGLTVTGGFGPVTVTAQGNFAYATSQEESEKNSTNFARDVVDRSVSKIQKKTKTERTTKTLREIEEINTHGFNNVPGNGHITGVYRWVDKRYRAQVYNYGVRLLMEFIVPEPSAYFRTSLRAAKKLAVRAVPPEPFLDQKAGPLTPHDINPSNYELFAARYNAAGVAPPPPEYTYVATALEQSGLQVGQAFSKATKELVVPDGYILDHYVASLSAVWEGYPQFSLQVGHDTYHVLTDNRGRGLTTSGHGVVWAGDWEDDARGTVPVSAVGHDIIAYTVHVEATCRRTPEAYELWQFQTYDKIFTAYKAMQTEYEQKLSQAEAVAGTILIEGRNPGLNREIEKRELKKACITLLTGKHFNHNNAMVYSKPPSTTLPEIDVLESFDEGPVIQFFEQAFDWQQVTYLFYPYFWSQKSRWLEMSNLSDNDPLFGHFLQAGAARVVVPVPMAYKDAVLYFLETGKIWNGGETPRLDDPLYISIHEELRNRTDDLQNATPEGTPWEFTIPTTLVWLQPGPELPVFEP